MFPFELVLGLLVGQKSQFLIVVVMFVLAKQASGAISVSAGKLVAVGLVSLLVVFPLVETYRDILRPEAGRQLSAAEAPGSRNGVGVTASTFARGPVAYGQYALDRTAGRFREVDRAAVAIRVHDLGRPFAPPSEMGQRMAIGVVPRVLWRDKPVDLYSLEVSREYFGLPSGVISASSLSPVGDAYRYGGVLWWRSC